MPSSRNPAQIVTRPGQAPANTVSSTALTFDPTGGGDGLQATLTLAESRPVLTRNGVFTSTTDTSRDVYGALWFGASGDEWSDIVQVVDTNGDPIFAGNGFRDRVEVTSALQGATPLNPGDGFIVSNGSNPVTVSFNFAVPNGVGYYVIFGEASSYQDAPTGVLVQTSVRDAPRDIDSIYTNLSSDRVLPRLFGPYASPGDADRTLTGSPTLWFGDVATNFREIIQVVDSNGQPIYNPSGTAEWIEVVSVETSPGGVPIAPGSGFYTGNVKLNFNAGIASGDYAIIIGERGSTSETSLDSYYSALRARTEQYTLNALAGGLDERYRRSLTAPGSPQVNAAGDGAVITRDGQAVTLVPTPQSWTANPYVDPYIANVVGELSSPINQSALQRAWSGDLNFVQLGMWRQIASGADELTTYNRPLAAFTSLNVRNPQNTTFGGSTTYTYLPVGSAATLNPGGVYANAVSVTAPHYYRNGTGRTAMILGYDVLVVTRAAGQRETYVATEILSDTIMRVVTPGGASPSFPSDEAVTVTWAHPLFNAGGAMTDAADDPNWGPFNVLYPSFNANEIGQYTAEMPPCRIAAPAMQPTAKMVLAIGEYEPFSGTITDYLELYADGALVNSSIATHEVQHTLARRVRDSVTITADDSYSWNPNLVGVLEIRINAPASDLTLTLAGSYTPQLGDELRINSGPVAAATRKTGGVIDLTAFGLGLRALREMNGFLRYVDTGAGSSWTFDADYPTDAEATLNRVVRGLQPYVTIDYGNGVMNGTGFARPVWIRWGLNTLYVGVYKGSGGDGDIWRISPMGSSIAGVTGYPSGLGKVRNGSYPETSSEDVQWIAGEAYDLTTGSNNLVARFSTASLMSTIPLPSIGDEAWILYGVDDVAMVIYKHHSTGNWLLRHTANAGGLWTTITPLGSISASDDIHDVAFPKKPAIGNRPDWALIAMGTKVFFFRDTSTTTPSQALTYNEAVQLRCVVWGQDWFFVGGDSGFSAQGRSPYLGGDFVDNPTLTGHNFERAVIDDHGILYAITRTSGTDEINLCVSRDRGNSWRVQQLSTFLASTEAARLLIYEDFLYILFPTTINSSAEATSFYRTPLYDYD